MIVYNTDIINYPQDALLFTPTHVRSARLANFVTALMKFKNDIDRQILAPVRYGLFYSQLMVSLLKETLRKY